MWTEAPASRLHKTSVWLNRRRGGRRSGTKDISTLEDSSLHVERWQKLSLQDQENLNEKEETHCKPHWFEGFSCSYTGKLTMTMYLGDPHQDQKTLYFGLCINVSMWMQGRVCTVCVRVSVITPFCHLTSSKESFSTRSCTPVLVKQTQCDDTPVSPTLCILIRLFSS